MPAQFSFAIKQITYFQGAMETASGPSASFVFVCQGQVPTAAMLQTLHAKLPVLWAAQSQLPLSGDTFRILLPSGDPGRIEHWLAVLLRLHQWLSMDPVDVPVIGGPHEGGVRIFGQYLRQQVFHKCLELSLRQLMLWLAGEQKPGEGAAFENHAAEWLARARASGQTPAAFLLTLAARSRKVPVSFTGLSFVALGWGSQRRVVESSFSHETPAVATRLARNKYFSLLALANAGIPVPKSGLAFSVADAERLASQWGWPVVVKPADQDQGLGVSLDLRDPASLHAAFSKAQTLSANGVLVEGQVVGQDHRLLVVRDRCLVVTRRTPARVVGDGIHSVAALIEQLNADPRRGSEAHSMLLRVELDDQVRTLLVEQGLTLDSIPPAGVSIRLRRLPNISQGGTADDLTRLAHPDNLRLAIRAARALGLDVAGVDFLCPDITRSWLDVGGAVCEVNSQPGLRVHWLGDPSRDLTGDFFDALHGSHGFRIPVAAVTGTNGKTTTCRMLQYILRAAQLRTGLSCSMGIWIDDECLTRRNLSGEPGGRMVLNNPDVQAAVIEMPRQGLVRFGHPCDRYDVSALLNIQDDHLGQLGINSKEEMARLKARILQRTGTAAVLNADDPLVMGVAALSSAPVILFSAGASNPALLQHIAAGGTAVYKDLVDGVAWLTVAHGGCRRRLMPLAAIPATMQGLLHFNELNALAATALALGMGMNNEVITSGLRSFHNSVECNPGRYNFLSGFPFQVLFDFAHNPEGVEELMRVVEKLEVPGKKWFVSSKIGNRHKRTLLGSLPFIAGRFDRYIIGCDPTDPGHFQDYGGENPMQTMLALFRAGLEERGVSATAILAEPWPERAIRLALRSAEPGDLVVIGGEPASALPFIQSLART